jgi:hypothetical protein
MKKQISPIIASAVLLLPLIAQAQGLVPQSQAVRNAGIARVGFSLIGMLVVMAIIIVPFVFWLLMLIDALKRRWPDRALWIVLLIVSLFTGLWLIIALLYYFLVKKKNLGGAPNAMMGPSPQRPPQPPAPPAA